MAQRLLVASRVFLPEAAAASLRLAGVARSWAERGGSVAVYTAALPGGQEWSEDGIEVKRWPVLRNAAGYVRGYLPYMSFDMPLLLRLMVARGPNVALVEPPPTTGIVASLVCSIRQIPWAYYAADIWSDAAAVAGVPRSVVSALRALERRAFAQADHVIAVSEGVGQRVQELGAKAVTVIPNGIDTDLFHPDAPMEPADEAIVPAQFVIYAGTASEWQGAEVFIKSVELVREQYPTLNLVFLAQGEHLPRLQQAAQGRDWIHFPGLRCPRSAAAWQARAQAALVSVVPGKGYDFAYPTKVLSALAVGTPVVFAGVGQAAADIEDSGLGRACAYDPESIADGLRDVLASPWDGAHLRQWVTSNRSQRAAANSVVDLLLGLAAKGSHDL